MKHKLTLIIVLLLVLSSIVYAAEETESSPCDGFFGSLKCFFVGNADNRAGMSWFDRSSNLVGQAGGPFVVCSADKINIGDKCVTKNEVGKPLVNSLSLKKGDVLMDKDGVKFKVDSVNPETGVITLDSASTIGSDNIQMFKLKEFSSEPIPVTSSSAATENPPTSVPPSTPIKTVSITTEPSNLEEITICSESKGGLCKEEVGYDTKVFYKEGGNYGKIYPVTSIKGTDVTYDKSKTKDEAIGFTAAKNPKSPAPASSAQPATTSSPNAAVNTPPNNVPTNARIEVQNGKTYWVDTSKIEGNVYDEEGNLVQGLNYDKKGEWSYGEGFEWKNKDPNSNSVEVVAKQGGQSSPGPTQTRAELKAEEPPKEKTALEKYQEKWIKDNCNKDGRPDCSRKDICVGKVVDSKCMVDGKIGDKTKTAISKELKIPKDQIEQVTAGGAEIQEIGPNKIITVIDGKDGNKITRTWEKNGVLGTKITEVKEEKGKPALTTTTFKNSKGALLYTQTTTKDKDNKDVTSVTHANGIAFTPDKNYDKNTGACKKGTACLKATSGEFAGRVHLQASENPYDSVPFTVEQPPSKVGNIKRTLSYQIKDSNDELVEINVQQECSKDCEGGLKTDKKEVGTNILTPDYVDFRTDYTSGVREYNTNQIGLFAHIDRGVGVDCTNFAGVNGCGTTVFFSTDNNLACKTEPCNAQNPTKQSTDTKGWEKNVCGDSCDGPKMIEAISDAHSSKNTQMFFAGQQTWQKAGGQILNGFSGWSSISNALVGDIYANELATDIDRWF
ncbi:hypothetical protein HQ489_02810, partial [Candidatus Woesearchaeota archaeon]|nr:hypothetical protein [Candidatus Woesearchaeota archaeon]